MSLHSSGRFARALTATLALERALTVTLPVMLLCLAALLPLQPARAQGVSASIQWYGVYTVTDTKSVEDSRAPTGYRLISTPTQPTSNTDSIPGRDGVHFGFAYVLSGIGGQDVKIRRVFRFPGDGMPTMTAGTKTRAYEDTQTYAVGEPVLMGWSFQDSPPERILFGEWVFEAWAGDQKLVSKRFTVNRP
jgi:hypothetical protein